MKNLGVYLSMRHLELSHVVVAEELFINTLNKNSAIPQGLVTWPVTVTLYLIIEITDKF